MRNGKIYLLIMMFTALCARVWGQDHMYSQFFDSPLYLNPALTGQFPADLRMNLIYRNQWTSVPGNFSYTTASIDYNIPRFGGGVGLMFTRSSEGTAYLKNNAVAATYAYSVGSDDFVLSFGLQAGVANRSIDYSKLVFDDQIDPRLGIIPGSTSAAESLPYNNKFYFDSGAGINLALSDFNIGMAVQHLNRPNESFTGTPVKMQLRETGHISYRWDLNAGDNLYDDEKSYIIPSIVLYKQGPAQSMSAGAQYKHKSVNVGLWYRTGGPDGPRAVVVSFIFDLFINREGNEKLRFGLSHDAPVTNSGLTYGNTSGISEGSISYETTMPSRDAVPKFEGARRCYDFY